MLQLVLATTAACKCEWEVKGSGSSGRVHEGPQALNCCIPCAHKLENFCANLWADEEHEQEEEGQEVYKPSRQAGGDKLPLICQLADVLWPFNVPTCRQL